MTLIKIGSGINLPTPAIIDPNEDARKVDLLGRITFPTPQCEICGGNYVDRFELEDDKLNEMITVIAYCHGDTSIAKFSYTQLTKLETHSAFGDPRRRTMQGRVRAKWNKPARDYW